MTSRPPVLVGIDGSRDGLIALAWGASYAVLQHAPLKAVHVVDDEQHLPADASGTGTEVLDEARQELDRIGFRGASLEVRHGRPAQVLPELAERATALVVARRGTGGFAELALGSTSRVCTALSTDVPLIVVPDTWDPFAPARGRIVVGCDGSEDAQDALRFAFELAAATHAGIVGVHADEVPEKYPDPRVPLDPDRQPWIETCDELLAQTLEGWSAKYPEVPVEHHGITDHPVLVLAHESADADLIVVGGVGRTAFSELRLGCVARGVLYHSQCPVAVVRHQEP